MIVDLQQALQALEDGDVVGLPTETVYGLAARLDRIEGLRKIFRIKERPFFDPLIVHVASIEQARACSIEWNEVAQRLANRFWPGPLTLVIPKSEAVPGLVTSGLETVGLRSPAHPVALSLIRESGPLAAPSANRFGRTSPTRAEHVRAEFRDQIGVLEGGPCEVGIESSIVSVESDGTLRLLRPGKITPAQISEALHGIAHRWEPARKTLAPGQMQHHYMPDIPLVILEADRPEADLRESVRDQLANLPAEVEGVRMLRPRGLDRLRRLSLPDDPALAARGLYQALREASQTSADLLYLVWPIERRAGDWEAVWDRLRKAASLHLS